MNIIKSKKQMFLVIGAFVLTLLLGTTTYAFFNYTRTGEANTIHVGRIAFNTTQTSGQDGYINLSNAFPIDPTETGIMEDATKVGTVTINVTGDTTYTGGVEYLVSAVNVTNTTGSKHLPISIAVSVDSNTDLGTQDNDYFTHRGANASTSIYKVLSGDTIETAGNILVGYIKSGPTGIDGDIVIKAYIDKNKVAISDTVDGPYGTETDTNWVGERTIFTTEEWNALRTNGISFQIRVEANEGTWVREPILTAAQIISNVQGLEETAGAKRYVGVNPNNYVIFNNEQWRIIGVYGNNLKIIKATPSITSQEYNSLENINAWSGSTMQADYLYTTYYPTLSSDATAMIEENAVWNVGACPWNVSADSSYSCSSSTTWVGKVGLIAAYEYLYAAEDDGTCRSQGGNIFNGYGGATNCAETDWIYNVLTTYNSSHQISWTMTPVSTNVNAAFIVYTTGYISDNMVKTKYMVSPVVYLKSNVTITGGTGESGGNEYTLGLIE